MASPVTAERYPTVGEPEAWAYASGLCAARETAFLAPRFMDELAGQTAVEGAARLARTFFGPAEPLGQFDRLAAARQAREWADLAAASPSGAPTDMVRARAAADEMRKGVTGVPDRLDGPAFRRAIEKLCLRAGDLADAFAGALDRAWPAPGDAGRTAAALAIDAAELLVVLAIADCAGDPVVERWAELSAAESSAQVAERSLSLRLPRGIPAGFFFVERLRTPRAADFLSEYSQPSAQAMHPDGFDAGHAHERLLGASAEALGEPFSAGRVLHYLLLFADQIRRLRRAAWVATGRLRREAA